MQHLAREMGRAPLPIAADAEETLVAHAWPGNLRELRNVLECALLVGTETVVRRADLRLNTAGARIDAPSRPDSLKDIEWQHIQQVLADEGGSVARAAVRLRIPRSTLYQKLKVQPNRLGSIDHEGPEGQKEHPR